MSTIERLNIKRLDFITEDESEKQIRQRNEDNDEEEKKEETVVKKKWKLLKVDTPDWFKDDSQFISSINLFNSSNSILILGSKKTQITVFNYISDEFSEFKDVES